MAIESAIPAANERSFKGVMQQSECQPTYLRGEQCYQHMYSKTDNYVMDLPEIRIHVDDNKP